MSDLKFAGAPSASTPDESRLHDILDLVEQARAEGDAVTESKAIAAYKRESAQRNATGPEFVMGTGTAAAPATGIGSGEGPRRQKTQFEQQNPKTAFAIEAGRQLGYPLLEMGTTAAGALGGTLTGGFPLGTMAGAGSAYAATKSGERSLDELLGKYTGMEEMEGGWKPTGRPIGYEDPNMTMSDRALRTAGEFALGAGAEALPVVLPAVKQAAQSRVVKSGLEAARNTARDAYLRAGQSLGYRIPASDVANRSMLQRSVSGPVEWAAGSTPLIDDLVLHNQAVTNNVARTEAGLPAQGKLSELTSENLQTARDILSQPYRNAAALPPYQKYVVDPLTNKATTVTVNPEAALEGWKQANYNAKRAYRAADAKGGDPELLAEARQYSDQATQFERQLQEAAKYHNDPDLFRDLEQARVKLAKNFQVDTALIEGTSSVKPEVFASMLQNGSKMSGNLKTVAAMNQAFRPYVKYTAKTTTGIPALMSGEGKFLSMANVPLIGGGGIPGVSAALRPVVKSKAYQGMLANPNYAPSVLTRVAAGMPTDLPSDATRAALAILNQGEEE